jgi:hypothetical protein
MTDKNARLALLVAKRVAQISPLLHGIGDDAQGGVLADLVAMWIAGHIVIGNPAMTDMMREEILTLWLDTMRKLIEPNAEMCGAAEAARGPRRQ